MEPTTQGQQSAAVTPDGSTTSQAAGTPAPANGVEKRIDELVGKFNSLQTEYQKVTEQNTMLVGTLAELAARANQPQLQPQQQVQVDPEEAARIRAVFGPELSRLEQLTTGIAARIGHQEFQAAANGEDARVVTRANELQKQWAAARLTGWKPEDALTYARGEIAKADRVANQQVQQARQQFQPGSPVLSGGNGIPVMAPEQAVPAELSKWSIDKQIEFWEKRSGDRAF